MTPDLPPVASNLVLDYNANDFYGNAFRVSLSQIRAANDGNDPVQIEIIEDSPNAGKRVVVSDVTLLDETQVLSFRLPNDEIPDDEYRFRVRITDHLGQTDESDLQSVALTRVPNELRFFKAANQATFNPIAFSVDANPVYQIEVLDNAGRRVPNQVVEWHLTPVDSGQGSTLGQTSSDLHGLTSLNLDPHRSTGLYTLLSLIHI